MWLQINNPSLISRQMKRGQQSPDKISMPGLKKTSPISRMKQKIRSPDNFTVVLGYKLVLRDASDPHSYYIT